VNGEGRARVERGESLTWLSWESDRESGGGGGGPGGKIIFYSFSRMGLRESSAVF